MARRIFLALTALLFLSSCVKKVYVPVLQEVKVAVPTECPRPPDLPDPTLPLGGVDQNTSNADTAKAYRLTVEILKQELKKRDALLDAYRQKFGKIEEGQPTQ